MKAQFISHPWLNENAIEKRTYQENLVTTALKGNTLCVLPTGLGKTNIAAMVTAERLSQDGEKKILFMAPTRPLVNQHMKTFQRFFKTGLTFNAITGETKPGDRMELYKDSDIVFSTPQCVANDLKSGIFNLAEFSLCIFDEAHRCVGNYAYTYVAKRYIFQAKKPLILALTASPGSHRQRVDEMKQKLYIDYVEVRDREDEDVKPFVQPLKEEWIEVELPTSMKTIKGYLEAVKNERIKKLMEWRIINTNSISKKQILELQQKLAKKGTGVGYAAMSMLAEVLKLDHALILLETQSIYSLQRYLEKLKVETTRAVARLQKEENFQNAVRLAGELYKEGVEHPKIEKLRQIVGGELQKNKFAKIIIFAQYRDTITRITEALEDVPLAAPVEFIGQAKKKGKGLSQKEQLQIINEFSMGFYNALIATQIGEEGLDIAETNLVIFYEPVPSAIRMVQRIGRTARTQPGRAVMMITKKTRDEAYHWSAKNKEKKMRTLLYAAQKQTQKSIGEFKPSQK
ncbi:MAG: DEAD/DEAH box helicase [Candidatus Aenigmarchaeota archaeon]|nr:DEAD/DEAH box helicase [Candidatus Aenigmarchaeota archaeon]